MIQMIKIANWLIEVNVEKTQEFYNKDLDLCNCLYCNNFVAACKHFNASVLDLFRKLGINPAKPAHLSEFPINEDGNRKYLGQYHLVGRVVKGELCTFSNFKKSNTIEIENFKFGFSEDLEFVPKNFPSPVVQLDYDANIPWVLNNNLEFD